GPGVPLQHEVEVGAADTAVRNLHQRFVRTERRDGELADGHLAVAQVHRGGHLLRDHGEDRTAERRRCARNDEAAGTGPAAPRSNAIGTSDHANVLCLVTLATRGYVELDVLALFEGLVAIALNRSEEHTSELQ